MKQEDCRSPGAGGPWRVNTVMTAFCPMSPATTRALHTIPDTAAGNNNTSATVTTDCRSPLEGGVPSHLQARPEVHLRAGGHPHCPHQRHLQSPRGLARPRQGFHHQSGVFNERARSGGGRSRCGTQPLIYVGRGENVVAGRATLLACVVILYLLLTLRTPGVFGDFF